MNRVDLTGFETGRLKVIKEAGKDKNGKTLWECCCSCGNICYKKTSQLTGALCEVLWMLTERNCKEID